MDRDDLVGNRPEFSDFCRKHGSQLIDLPAVDMHIENLKDSLCNSFEVQIAIARFKHIGYVAQKLLL